MDTKPKIVVVDDVPTIGELLTRFLTKRNYEVVTFTNGKDALEYLKQNQVDLVITDMHMPDMNGLAVVKSLKIMKADLPVILMSSYVDQEMLDEFIEMGIFDYVKKPFNLDGLEKIIAKMLLK